MNKTSNSSEIVTGRPRRKGLVTLVILTFLFLAAFYVSKLVYDAGAFKTLSPHFAGTCRSIEGINGAEDMEIDTLTQQLFISADNRPEAHGELTADGALYSLDLTKAETTPKRVSPPLPFSFHPHGLGLLRDQRGLRIFVVNHRQDPVSRGSSDGFKRPNAMSDTIEVFDLVGSSLSYVKSVADEKLTTPNDVTPINREQFYVTNDHGSPSPFQQSIESYTRIGRGNILFYDSRTFRVEVSHLSFANGIRVSADHAKIFLAETLARAVDIYDRDASGLKFVKKIDLGTAPDNIDVNSDGSLWIGAHPNLFKLKASSHDHTKKAPAQIVRVREPLSDQPVVEELFLDDGDKISAASVGVKTNGRLFIGSIFDRRMLDCTQKSQ